MLLKLHSYYKSHYILFNFLLLFCFFKHMFLLHLFLQYIKAFYILALLEESSSILKEIDDKFNC